MAIGSDTPYTAKSGGAGLEPDLPSWSTPKAPVPKTSSDLANLPKCLRKRANMPELSRKYVCLLFNKWAWKFDVTPWDPVAQ
jgi:hypothetical protein